MFKNKFVQKLLKTVNTVLLQFYYIFNTVLNGFQVRRNLHAPFSIFPNYFSYPDGFNCNDLIMFLPHGLVNLSVLSPSQLVPHGDVRPLDLPLIRLGRDAIDGGLVHLGGREAQRGDQAICILAVVMDQLCHAAELALVGHVYLLHGGERWFVLLLSSFLYEVKWYILSQPAHIYLKNFQAIKKKLFKLYLNVWSFMTFSGLKTARKGQHW